MASNRSYEITGIEWQRPPTQVAVGEQFDLVVRVLGSAAEETEGQPITFYVDGEELFTTSGADIPAGDFAFDGRIDVVFDEPGTYELTASVGEYTTEPHYLGVGGPPQPNSVDIGGASISQPAALVAGLAVLEGARRIFT